MILRCSKDGIYYAVCPGSVGHGKHRDPYMFLVDGSMYPRLDKFLWATTTRAVPNWPFMDFESLEWYKPSWLRFESRSNWK
jgi:hypothetical protein